MTKYLNKGSNCTKNATFSNMYTHANSLTTDCCILLLDSSIEANTITGFFCAMIPSQHTVL